MIEPLRAYIKTIAVFLIFIMFIQFISTEKSEKYTGFVCRIIFMLILCIPLSNLFSFNEYAKEAIYKSIEEYKNTDYTKCFADDKSVLKDIFSDNIEKSIKNDMSAFSFDVLYINICLNNENPYDGIAKIEADVKGDGNVESAETFLKEKYGAKNVVLKYR